MHPERPTTGFTLRRQLADSSPRGTLSTGPVQGGPGQSARRPRFCLLLPGVHAADVSSAQPAQMPSSPSSTCVGAPPHPSAASTLPSNIGKPEFPDTGWDRIKDLFQKELVFFLSLPFLFFTVLLIQCEMGDFISYDIQKRSFAPFYKVKGQVCLRQADYSLPVDVDISNRQIKTRLNSVGKRQNVRPNRSMSTFHPLHANILT